MDSADLGWDTDHVSKIWYYVFCDRGALISGYVWNIRALQSSDRLDHNHWNDSVAKIVVSQIGKFVIASGRLESKFRSLCASRRLKDDITEIKSMLHHIFQKLQ